MRRAFTPCILQLLVVGAANAYSLSVSPTDPTAGAEIVVHVASSHPTLCVSEPSIQRYSASGIHITAVWDMCPYQWGPNPPHGYSISLGTLPTGLDHVVFSGVPPAGAAWPPLELFTWSNVGAPPPPRQTVSGTWLAVEYFHAGLDHYFVTANADEQAKLDAGRMAGWARTGASFWVYPPGTVITGDLSAHVRGVCRYYGLPQAGLNSHFYSASFAECEQVEQRFSNAWILEGTDVFGVFLPDESGACRHLGTPIFRVYNNRPDANHRYVLDRALRDTMLARGWIKEGYGPDGVVMCAPQ